MGGTASTNKYQIWKLRSLGKTNLNSSLSLERLGPLWTYTAEGSNLSMCRRILACLVDSLPFIFTIKSTAFLVFCFLFLGKAVILLRKMQGNGNLYLLFLLLFFSHVFCLGSALRPNKGAKGTDMEEEKEREAMEQKIPVVFILTLSLQP